MKDYETNLEPAEEPPICVSLCTLTDAIHTNLDLIRHLRKRIDTILSDPEEPPINTLKDGAVSVPTKLVDVIRDLARRVDVSNNYLNLILNNIQL